MSLKSRSMMFGHYKELPLVCELPQDYVRRAAAEVAEGLRACLGEGADVEHVGSTVYGDVPGKNSVNMLVAIARGQFPWVLEQLEAMGLEEHPAKLDPEDRPVRAGTLSYQGMPVVVHVKVVEKGGYNHVASLFFRDYLLSHPEARQAYADLKRRLVANGATAEEYAVGKQPFIRDIIAKCQEL